MRVLSSQHFDRRQSMFYKRDPASSQLMASSKTMAMVPGSSATMFGTWRKIISMAQSCTTKIKNSLAKLLATMSAIVCYLSCCDATYPNWQAKTDGAASNLNWTSAKMVKTGSNYIDVQFDATEGDMHWAIFNGLAGSYQYFVNRALPVFGGISHTLATRQWNFYQCVQCG